MKLIGSLELGRHLVDTSLGAVVVLARRPGHADRTTTSSPTLIGRPPDSASTRVYSFEPTEAGSFCIRLTKSAEGARKLRAV